MLALVETAAARSPPSAATRTSILALLALRSGHHRCENPLSCHPGEENPHRRTRGPSPMPPASEVAASDSRVAVAA